MHTKFLSLVSACLLVVIMQLHADPVSPKTFKATIQNLDGSVKEGAIKSKADELGTLLKLEGKEIESALLEKKLNYSTIALAQLVGEKTGQKYAEVIAANPSPDWLALLTKAGVPTTEALERLEYLHAEVAFMMMDFREGKVAKKKK